MRFKKLELLGFKSFAEATEIIFEPGITAVVGPNGCGKSNISDSIKWVLGEQSARELRGGKMEDVIFNGSDRRDPIHYAEVSLTLDNADKKLPIEYGEVTISRRLFRSGESEYLLNKTAVRLRDIHELLMGTGIGTSAYSLFEQGRIEQIISAHPEDRRAVFEEAAGITKFKSQKREAMRRLEETEENLARVSDVIAEVKRQTQSLERQVRRAKAYQEQMEELKELELGLAGHETEKLNRLWREKEEALSSSRAEVEALEKESGGQEERLARARSAVSEADRVLSQAREAFLGVQHRQETLRNSAQVNRERITEGLGRADRVQREIEEGQAQTFKLQGQAKALAAVVAQQEEERRRKEEKIGQCRERLSSCGRVIEEAEAAIAQAKERLMDLAGAQVQVKNQLSRVRQEAARLEARVNRLQTESAKVAGEQEEAAGQVKRLEEGVLETRTLFEDLDRERQLCRENLSGTESALCAAQQEASQLQQELTRCGSQLEMLKGLVASHEGYSSGVKALLTALEQGRLSGEGISGVLAELIQVDRSELAAVEAALGNWAEAVVVDSAETAERCRQFLEETRAGRVLFLIRERVPGNLKPVPGTKQEKPVPGTEQTRTRRTEPTAVAMLDRVGITPHLTPLLQLILADAWLVPDRKTAQAYASASAVPTERFVTPGGEIFASASLLLGPPPAEEGMIVGRISRLQSLEIAFTHAEGRLQETKQKTTGLQYQRAAQAEALEGLEARLRERSEELHRMEATHASAKTALEKFSQERELLKAEEAEAVSDLKEIRAQVEQGETDLAAKDQEMEACQQEIQRAQEKIAEAGRTREEVSVEMSAIRAELASFDEVTAGRRSSLTVLEQSLESAGAQVQARRGELLQLQQRVADWESSCRQIEAQLVHLESEKTQAQGEVEQATSKRQEASAAAGAQEKRFLEVQRRLEQLQSKLHGQEMEQAQLSFQREQITSRLLQVYQINLEEPGAGPVEPILEEELEGARGRIEELSQKLQRMGPVNLGSIDEERELQSRYEFLTTQQNDLLKAKDDLHEALTKINRTTRAMFRETFQAIQKEFQITFKQLFGGGESQLVLLDEEDLLESGIEIIARPPGKPLQPISLLSGGEKALTTIALLFAIFRVKPSPFCLLDEIDAPLDEANIDRFTRALKEFLKDSQFIIITHNKKTMGMADVLYGITMQEMGVSKIVSVKFKENGHANGNGHAAAA